MSEEEEEEEEEEEKEEQKEMNGGTALCTFIVISVHSGCILVCELSL